MLKVLTDSETNLNLTHSNITHSYEIYEKLRQL